MQQLVWMRMEISMRMGSLKLVEDTLRYIIRVHHRKYHAVMYLQMVWARTYAMGCGAFRCAELNGAEDDNENALFLVCYYGPGYNMHADTDVMAH